MFTFIPMLFVMAITLWALVIQATWAFAQKIELNATMLNGLVSIVLILLALMLILEAIRTNLMRPPLTAEPTS